MTDLVVGGLLDIAYVQSHHNLADLGTKALERLAIQREAGMCGLIGEACENPTVDPMTGEPIDLDALFGPWCDAATLDTSELGTSLEQSAGNSFHDSGSRSDCRSNRIVFSGGLSGK